MRADITNVSTPSTQATEYSKLMPKEQLLEKLHASCDQGMHASFRLLTQYVGASHYLLVRYDLSQESLLDLVITADWPFDLVRQLSKVTSALYAKSNEMDKCLVALQPAFVALPPDAHVPIGASKEFCSVMFSVGRTRFRLMLLFPQDVILSQDRVRDVALLAGYVVSLDREVATASVREFELTDRELECLSWIAEGKTSDEIAVIIGISRNTINNYITSVMRKTATRTRSEAIAFAVRHNLV